VYFDVGDAWKIASLLRIQQKYYFDRIDNQNDDDKRPSSSTTRRKIGFDAVYVDVGGLSGSDGLLDTISLLKSIQQGLEPTVIVIKSMCLQQFAKRFSPYWRWQKQQQQQQQKQNQKQDI
jgi:hypothetical protein